MNIQKDSEILTHQLKQELTELLNYVNRFKKSKRAHQTADI